jgi:hypothetical protein
MGIMTTFAPGRTIVRRYFRGDHVSWAQAVRVIADDADGLLLWLPVGAGFAWRVNAAGEVLRGATVAEFGASRLVNHEWQDSDVLMLLRPGAAHAVWWFFREGEFTGWYVNLESPMRRGPDRIDLIDHHLDIVVSPDRRWAWKDEDDFATSTDKPGFWTAAEARDIRADGERVVKEIEAGAFPFDGTWCRFRPDPAWPPPALPADGWQHS